MESLPHKMALPPWNHNETLDRGLKVGLNESKLIISFVTHNLEMSCFRRLVVVVVVV